VIQFASWRTARVMITLATGTSESSVDWRTNSLIQLIPITQLSEILASDWSIAAFSDQTFPNIYQHCIYQLFITHPGTKIWRHIYVSHNTQWTRFLLSYNGILRYYWNILCLIARLIVS